MVKLRPEWVAAGVEYEEKLKQTRLFETPNYTGFEDENRFLTGMVGELAFADLLRSRRLRFEHLIRPNGKSCREPEFTVWEMGEPKTVEIKTAGREFHRKLVIPLAQNWQHAHYVVALRIIIGRMQVAAEGWLPGEQVAQMPVEVMKDGYQPSRTRLFKELYPMRLLLDCVDPV